MNDILKQAAYAIKLKQKYLDILSRPERVVEVNFPVKMDSGSIEIFKGFRVQHSTALGPSKGGIRFHPAGNRDEVSDLAFWMAIKCAVAGLPYGGSKGEVIVDVKSLSKKELERLTRAYTRAIADVIGPLIDIPAPDVYTNPQIMSWVYDEYAKIQIAKAELSSGRAGKISDKAKNQIRKNSLAVVTGKPINLGGSLGRDTATAQGGVYVLEKLLKILNLGAKKLSVSIQGFGNAGSFVAKLLFERGFKIIAVSDSQCAILSNDMEIGLDIKKLLIYKARTGSVKNFEGSQEISQKDLVCEPIVDIFVPAALGGLITKDDAHKLGAKVILELANGPLQAGVDEILEKRGILVIPDVLANAGGVTVSYFEWCQNLADKYWTKEKVFFELKKTLTDSFNKIWKLKKRYNVSLRVAAYILALERISKKIKI